MSERVVLVDACGAEIGSAEKLAAHRAGRLHRAFSIFVFNGCGEMLLQQRAAGKYHSPRRWSNTCCGHPRPGEDTLQGARRRLREEMNLDCTLVPAFRFSYRADLGNGIVENEYDHVFVGRSDRDPVPDPDEVAAWRWASLDEVAHAVAAQPYAFTAWFPIALRHLLWHGVDAIGGRAEPYERFVQPYRANPYGE
jgi:isopentenyl-diphosphate delta-isomerase